MLVTFIQQNPWTIDVNREINTSRILCKGDPLFTMELFFGLLVRIFDKDPKE